jgi:mannose-6-phosphate isomerase-like protein (cupin superfamily)
LPATSFERLPEEVRFDSSSYAITPRQMTSFYDVSREAHVLLSGTMEYVVGNRRFTVTAPYVARVPAGVAHTFVNAGTTPGANPLLEK